jgi:formylglycine-generating enzyme required for sulfatase activity
MLFRSLLRRRFQFMLTGLFLSAFANQPNAHGAAQASDAQSRSLREGQRAIRDLDLELVWVAPGSFVMGTAAGGVDSERPVTQVRITKGYWLGKTEVTQGQWWALMGTRPAKFADDERPVEQVSWHDAIAFCAKLTERERTAGRLPAGFAYALPTEAQWEYACRAGTTGDYAGELDALGWYDKNSLAETHLVGKKQPNAWGFFDMHGNVWEWCLDWDANYLGDSSADPQGEPVGLYRISRGGSWSTSAIHCRSALRRGSEPNYRRVNLGFRLALSVVAE